MKTVVFASLEDCLRPTIAAAFFDAFTHPAVMRALAISGRTQRTPPEVLAAMQEVGVAAPDQAQAISLEALESAVLVVHFGELRADVDVPSERWDTILPGGATVERIRETRDVLRRRVWRLVAQHGWYRLQPAQAIRASQPR